MKSLAEIKRSVERFRIEPTAEMREKTLACALKAQEEAKKIDSPLIGPNMWRIVRSRITKLAAASVILIAVSLGLYHFTVSLEVATPVFADVVRNMLSQKWVYMFAEDREEGRINAEYWYNPAEQKIYAKSHNSKGSAFVLDIKSREMHEYRDNTITITKPDDFDDYTDMLGQSMPVLCDLISRYERQGARIVQKDALYNSQPAFLYEIEIILPDDGDAFRTDKYSWLVDRKTHLPIICEHTHLYGRDYAGSFKQRVMRSYRYAFDYSDSGPTDIYDLGVPVDANIVDERPLPEIRKLIDRIDQAKRTKYNSFAAVIVREYRPRRLVIRDGRKIRDEYFELGINGSDWEPKKEQYLLEMGNTFESIYQWLGRTDIMRRQGIMIVDEQFRYRTDHWAIEDNESVEMGRRSGNHDSFSSYCWQYKPAGQIVTTPYSEEHNLVCTLVGDWYRYYDPAKDYMSVRRETKEGHVHYEILDSAQTPAGMWYPCKIRQGYHPQKAGDEEILSESGMVYIYAADMTDELSAKLDPRTLPNFVDHRELTRQMKLQQVEGAQDEACVEYTGFTPLHMAIYRQNTERVKKYIDEGADLEPAYDSGATPMELAVASGNLDMVKLLYEHGADFVSNDDKHRDALGLAAKERFYEIAQFMLARGSDVDAVYKHQSTPLHYAAANGDVRMVELLLAHGPEIDPRGESRRTPLYNAIDYLAGKLFYPKPTEQGVIQRFKDIIIMLIDKGADINMRNTSERTALSRSIIMFDNDQRNARQQIEFLRFLLDCGADPNSDAKLGHNSSFYRAAEAKRYDIVEVLLEGGADPWLVVDARYSPARHSLLYFAHKIGDDKLYDLLYPYMKQRHEQTNAEVLQAADRVFRAIMQNDTAAIGALCVDHPGHSNPWKSWPKKIREFYKGHADLIDKMIPGWFTPDGLAEVYIPLPEGTEKKSVLLGFIQYPDGQWKCIYYRPMNYMPQNDRPGRAYFVADPSELDEFRNNLYDQASMPEQLQTHGSSSIIRRGKFTGELIVSVQDDALRVDFDSDDKRWRKRYVLLTKDYVKKYRDNELAVYTKEYIEKQKDYPQRLVYQPLTMIVENGDTKHVFTVSDGQVLLIQGERKTKAPRFVFDLSTYKVVSSK